MRVDGTSAGRRIRAWSILRDGQEVATVQMHLGLTHSVLVNAFNGGTQHVNPDAVPSRSYQEARASGPGLDKFQRVMQRLSLCGYVIGDDGVPWEDQLRGRGLTVIRAI